MNIWLLLARYLRNLNSGQPPCVEFSEKWCLTPCWVWWWWNKEGGETKIKHWHHWTLSKDPVCRLPVLMSGCWAAMKTAHCLQRPNGWCCVNQLTGETCQGNFLSSEWKTSKQRLISEHQWVKRSPSLRRVCEYVRLQGEYNKMHWSPLQAILEYVFPAYMMK